MAPAEMLAKRDGRSSYVERLTEHVTDDHRSLWSSRSRIRLRWLWTGPLGLQLILDCRSLYGTLRTAHRRESALGVTGGRRRGLRVLASSASRGVAIDDLAVRSRLAGVNGVGVGSGSESFCQ